MSDTPYQTNFPLESGSRLVQAVLGRESQPVPRMVKDGFNIQSFVLGQVVGEPADGGAITPARTMVFGLSNISGKATLHQLATKADALLKEGRNAPPEAQAGLFSNPLLLELLSRLASKLLEKYLK
jgi:hypothetical protein